jgi:hypothetical protein
MQGYFEALRWLFIFFAGCALVREIVEMVRDYRWHKMQDAYLKSISEDGE